jgi:hypothetical protein
VFCIFVLRRKTGVPTNRSRGIGGKGAADQLPVAFSIA